jgi:uncharacterized protein (TIGR02246 family)
MGRTLSISVFVMISVMAGCTPAGNPSQTAVKGEGDAKAINKLRDDFLMAWKAGDSARVADGYTQDAILLPQNGPPVTGKSAILTFEKNFFDQFTPTSFELSSEELQTLGDWAFDRGTYRFTVTPRTGGESVSDQGKYLVLLQRQSDGSWKVARDIDNSSNPRPQPTSSSKSKS